jgi:phage gp29-like protein
MVMLYDQFGREIRVEKRPETREVAVAAVRDRWSTYPSQGLTPQKLTTLFKQADGGDVYAQAELFEEMEEKDTHLFSQLQTRKNAVLGLEYAVTPYSDSAEDKKIAEFVGDVFSNLNDFDDHLLDALDAVGKGYSMSEIMWATDGNRAVIERLEWIHAKKAIFTDMAADSWQKTYEMPRVVTEAEPFMGEIMPPFKMIYHRYKARSGYDTRAGVLRVCAWMYLFKNYSLKDWVAFMEVFGMPIRLGKYDAGAGQADKDALITAIGSLGSDAAGIISKNTEIEFVETTKGQSKENPFSVLANFCDAQISKAILGQTLTTQEGSSGSYSLGQVHDLVRHDLIKADCEALSKTLRFQAVRPLVGYNFGWDKPLPKFKFKFEPPEDLKALSEVYKNLSEINYPLTVEHVSERFKIPAPQKGETVLAPKTSPMALKHSRVVAKSGRFSPEQENIEGLVEASQKKATQALSGLTVPIRAMIATANSLEEIRDRIIASYSDMNPSELEDLLARAMFAAELYGRAAVEKKMRETDDGSS